MSGFGPCLWSSAAESGAAGGASTTLQTTSEAMATLSCLFAYPLPFHQAEAIIEDSEALDGPDWVYYDTLPVSTFVVF